MEDSLAQSAPAFEAPATLDAREVIEGIVEPVLIVTEGRVSHANAAARKLLGSYILGEDVRLAIRHPAAVDTLTHDMAPEREGPIDLVGLGGLDQPRTTTRGVRGQALAATRRDAR